MATMYEQQVADPSLEAFLETRQQLRGMALRELETRWAAYQERVRKLEDMRDALEQEIEDTGTRGKLSFGRRIIAKGAMRQDMDDLFKEATREWKHAVADLNHRFNIHNPNKAIASDLADYQAAVIASQGRSTIDPVLTHIPGARLHRDSNGWDVYTSGIGFRGLLGKVELMRVLGDAVIVRGADTDHIRAGIIAANERCKPPLRFNGSPAFVSQALKIAKELGVPVAGQPVEEPNTIHGEPKDPIAQPTVAATTAGAEQVPTPPPRPSLKDLYIVADQTMKKHGLVQQHSPAAPGQLPAMLLRHPDRTFVVLAKNDESAILWDSRAGATMSIDGEADSVNIASLPAEGMEIRFDYSEHGFMATTDVTPWDKKYPERGAMPPWWDRFRDRYEGAEAQENAGPEPSNMDAHERAMLVLSEFCDKPLLDFTDAPHEQEAEGHLVATAVVDGVTYAAIDVNGFLMAVRLDGAPGVQIGAPIKVAMAPGGTQLTAVDDVAPEEIIEEELGDDAPTDDAPTREDSLEGEASDQTLPPQQKRRRRRRSGRGR
jgi:hypothetical protein